MEEPTFFLGYNNEWRHGLDPYAYQWFTSTLLDINLVKWVMVAGQIKGFWKSISLTVYIAETDPIYYKFAWKKGKNCSFKTLFTIPVDLKKHLI